MLDKLKTDFDDILSLVNKAPAPLQETALKMILEHWFTTNAPVTPPQAPPTNKGGGAAPPVTGVPDSIKPFLTANAITTDVLERVYHPAGPGAQLLAGEIPGNGKASKMINLSLLLCVKQALESGNFTCALKDLREMAMHYDCYDSPNFSSNLKSYKNYYKPRERGQHLELSGPGLKKAGELIKEIAQA